MYKGFVISECAFWARDALMSLPSVGAASLASKAPSLSLLRGDLLRVQGSREPWCGIIGALPSMLSRARSGIWG